MTSQEERRCIMLDLVRNSYTQLTGISDEEAAQPIEPGEWSRKQVIGHLIDSACNNHQRFVRAQWCEKLEFPSYQQDEWVDCQKYNLRAWHELLDFWKAYNEHLAHIIGVMDEESLETPCVVGWSSAPNSVIPLSEVIEHYWEHLEHHLNQIWAGDR
jgi:uncharacterized damage-inducible protein DinB